MDKLLEGIDNPNSPPSIKETEASPKENSRLKWLYRIKDLVLILGKTIS